MRYTNYQFDPVGTPLGPLLWECLKLPAATIKAALANRARIGAFGPYMYRRLLFAIRGLTRRTEVNEH